MKTVSKWIVSGSALFPLGVLLLVSLGLLSSEQSLNRQEIQYIQGVLCTRETGVLDANTRQALGSYQRANGLVPNTVLDRSQISRLLRESPCRPGRRTYYENTLSEAKILALQRKLQVAPTGALGAWTRRALRAFQQKEGLAARRGILTPELLQRISEADGIQTTPPEPLYGLGIPLAEGNRPWVRVNQLSEVSRYPIGTRLTLTSLGMGRRSVEVEVVGSFREENPRKIVQISRQAARLLQLGERREVAVMIEEATLP